MDEHNSKYLVIVQFKADTSIPELANRVPELQKQISSLCKGNMEQVFRSPEGLTFGVFMKSSKAIEIIRSVLDEATVHGDGFLVLEVAGRAEAKLFGRPLTWLQRH